MPRCGEGTDTPYSAGAADTPRQATSWTAWRQGGKDTFHGGSRRDVTDHDGARLVPIDRFETHGMDHANPAFK